MKEKIESEASKMIIRYQDQLFENQALYKKLQAEKEKIEARYKQLQLELEDDRAQSSTWRGKKCFSVILTVC